MSKKRNTQVYLTNMGKYNEGELVGEWLSLPCTKAELKLSLRRIGIDGIAYEEYFITDYETDYDGLKISEYDEVIGLSALIKKLDALSDHDYRKLQALLEIHYYSDEAEALENLDNITLNEGITTKYELGEWHFNEFYSDIVPMELHYCINFERLGDRILLDGHCDLTSFGLLEH